MDTPDLYLVFSDEAMFHLSGIVNKQNVRFWWSKNPHASVEFVHESPTANVFCALFKGKVTVLSLLKLLYGCYDTFVNTNEIAQARTPARYYACT
jgi:hypothetical protein